MAKRCPLTGDAVLYIDCLECVDRASCGKRGGAAAATGREMGLGAAAQGQAGKEPPGQGIGIARRIG